MLLKFNKTKNKIETILRINLQFKNSRSNFKYSSKAPLLQTTKERKRQIMQLLWFRRRRKKRKRLEYFLKLSDNLFR